MRGCLYGIFQTVRLTVRNRLARPDYSNLTYPLYYRVLLDGRNICAGEMLGGADTCLGQGFMDQSITFKINLFQLTVPGSRLGDSGGPLMCQRKGSCAWYIAGIISWSYSCGETYGVYMSTNYYRDWVLKAINGP